MKTFLLTACCAFLVSFAVIAEDNTQIEPYGCVPSGHWVQGSTGESISIADVIPDDNTVILAGEMHTNMPIHLWQYYLIVEAFQKNPDMVIAMESFPRYTQPILDKWIAGGYGTDINVFAEEINWQHVWGYDLAYYAPILRYAQQNKIPIHAMNVSKELTQSIRSVGWEGTPEALKEGISKPSVPTEDYLQGLSYIYRMHGYENNPNAPSFQNFVLAQLVWDRSFADVIASQANQGKMVVAIVGQGHVEFGWGIEHQLRSLNINKVIKLLPWLAGFPCEYFDAEQADIFYGI